MGKLGTSVQKKRKRYHMKACISHTRLLNMDSGRGATMSARHVAKQPTNVEIKLTRTDTNTLRVLLPKALPLTQRRTRSNWMLHLKPLFLPPTFFIDNENQSWLGTRETRGPVRWWDQLLLAILHIIPSLCCIPISPVPTCSILFTPPFSVALLDSHHLLRWSSVL